MPKWCASAVEKAKSILEIIRNGTEKLIVLWDLECCIVLVAIPPKGQRGDNEGSEWS